MRKELEKCRKIKGVKDVRVLGAIGVVEIEANFEKIVELRKKFIAAGIFLRPFGNCVYIMPALTIGERELKRILDGVYSVLSV